MRPRLTPRRHQVLVLAARGYSDREIGEQLGLSPKTVQMHRQRAQLLLRLRTFEEIVRWMRQDASGPRPPQQRGRRAAVSGPSRCHRATSRPRAGVPRRGSGHARRVGSRGGGLDSDAVQMSAVARPRCMTLLGHLAPSSAAHPFRWRAPRSAEARLAARRSKAREGTGRLRRPRAASWLVGPLRVSLSLLGAGSGAR
jgi:DNA-binding CsgD family transcriptional regulator